MQDNLSLWEKAQLFWNALPFLLKVLPELFRAVRMCEDGGLKEFITWKLGTLVSIVRQVRWSFQCCAFAYCSYWKILNFFLLLLISHILHISSSLFILQHIRKYLQEILSLVSELWTSSFSLPAPNRTVQGPQASPVIIHWALLVMCSC